MGIFGRFCTTVIENYKSFNIISEWPHGSDIYCYKIVMDMKKYQRFVDLVRGEYSEFIEVE